MLVIIGYGTIGMPLSGQLANILSVPPLVTVIIPRNKKCRVANEESVCISLLSYGHQ